MDLIPVIIVIKIIMKDNLKKMEYLQIVLNAIH